MQFNKFVRRTHMYLALFLTPWVVMYAISTVAMNHSDLFNQWYGDTRPSYTTEREIDYPKTIEPDADLSATAQQFLDDTGLDGLHYVQGDLRDGVVTIRRADPFAPRRVVYDAKQQLLTVERQEVRPHALLNQLHGRRGFNSPYLTEDLWSLSVEIVTVAIVFWTMSGLWLWWGLKTTRRWGGVCLLAGATVFSLFLFSI